MNDITLSEKQLLGWNDNSRFLGFFSGIQGGKTTFGVVWMLREIIRKGAGEYIVITPTYKMLKQSTLIKFQDMVPKGYGVLNKSDSTFTTGDGVTIFFRSADKPESIEGITAQAIWADEASLMKAYIWIMMQGRVSKTQGRVLLTGTPLSLNWVHKEIYQRWKKGDKDYGFVRFANVDAPWFPREEYERARRTLSETQFKLRYKLSLIHI